MTFINQAETINPIWKIYVHKITTNKRGILNNNQIKIVFNSKNTMLYTRFVCIKLITIFEEVTSSETVKKNNENFHSISK